MTLSRIFLEFFKKTAITLAYPAHAWVKMKSSGHPLSLLAAYRAVRGRLRLLLVAAPRRPSKGLTHSSPPLPPSLPPVSISFLSQQIVRLCDVYLLQDGAKARKSCRSRKVLQFECSLEKTASVQPSTRPPKFVICSFTHPQSSEDKCRISGSLITGQQRIDLRS